MADMSPAQARQVASKSVADVFGPLEDDAIATLKESLSKPGRIFEPKVASDNAKFVLEKLYGKTPDQAQGNEPLWMKVMRRAIQVDGVPAEQLPGMAEALNGNGTITGEVEEITFEFVWPNAS